MATPAAVLSILVTANTADATILAKGAGHVRHALIAKLGLNMDARQAEPKHPRLSRS
jgi:hypothetical protein